MTLIRGYVESSVLVDRFRVFLRAMGRSPATERPYRRGGQAVREGVWVIRAHLGCRPALHRHAAGLGVPGVDQHRAERAAGLAWLDGAGRARELEAGAVAAAPMAAPDLKTFVGLRDHVIMVTLYRTQGQRSGQNGNWGTSGPTACWWSTAKTASTGWCRSATGWLGLVGAYVNQRPR